MTTVIKKEIINDGEWGIFGCGSEEPLHNKDSAQSAEQDDNDNDVEFIMQTWKEDFVLIIEGRRLYVNSGFLIVTSPVLAAKLKPVLDQPGKARELTIPGKRYEDFFAFLRCIYSSTKSDICQDNVRAVLPLADEYKIRYLKESCEQFLVDTVDENMPIASIYELLNCAALYKLGTLLDVCERIALQNDLKDIDKVGGLQLPLEVTVRLQNKMLSQLQDTIESLNGQLNYARTRCTDLEKVAKSAWYGWHANVPDADIGIVKLVVSDTLRNIKPSESESVSINDAEFTFVAHTKAQRQGDIFFSLEMSPPTHLYSWSCKVHIKLKFLARGDFRNIVATDYVEFSEAKLIRDIYFAKKTMFNCSSNYFWEGDRGLRVEVYLLVYPIVHKRKRAYPF